jgi:hypothetical protein
MLRNYLKFDGKCLEIVFSYDHFELFQLIIMVSTFENNFRVTEFDDDHIYMIPISKEWENFGFLSFFVTKLLTLTSSKLCRFMHLGNLYLLKRSKVKITTQKFPLIV